MRNQIIALPFIAALAFVAVAKAQTIPAGTSSSGVTFIATSTRTCSIMFDNGDVKTEGCDFSLPLRNPKFMPSNYNKRKIEFDQTVPSASTGTMIVPAPAR